MTPKLRPMYIHTVEGQRASPALNGRTVCIAHLEVLGIKEWGEGRVKWVLQICRMNVKRDTAHTLTPGFNVLLNNHSESIRLEKQGRAGFFVLAFFLPYLFSSLLPCAPQDLPFSLGNCQQAYCNDRSDPLLPD